MYVTDWEALADREPSTLLSAEELPQISKLSVEEPKVEGPKRRGRGTFTYNKDVMYSESRFEEDSGDNDVARGGGSEKTDESLKGIKVILVIINVLLVLSTTLEFLFWYIKNAAKYGTRHVLVFTDFSPNLRTTDLERLFVDFKDSGFLIRWVNDTTALAVFKTPSTGTV